MSASVAPAAHEREESTVWPPPTRMVAKPDEAFHPPEVVPVPEVPEAGLWPALKYSVVFTRARMQRRGAIKSLREQIRRDTGVLDGILGSLGKQARALGVLSRPLEDENRAINEAEQRRERAEQECAELAAKQTEETGKFTELEGERAGKATEAESSLEVSQSELSNLEAQRRGLRDKRKEIERRQKGYLKAAADREAESAKQEITTQRESLRRSAEELRRDAAALDPERQDVERRLDALEKPIAQATAKVGSLKAEVDSVRRSLNDVREGHRHRLTELDAEQARKARELAQAEAEIQRRLVTLGTIINLNRVERPEFDDLYRNVDELREAIGARSSTIDRLAAERDAYDKPALIRGFIVLGGIVVLLLTVLAIVLSL